MLRMPGYCIICKDWRKRASYIWRKMEQAHGNGVVCRRQARSVYDRSPPQTNRLSVTRPRVDQTANDRTLREQSASEPTGEAMPPDVADQFNQHSAKQPKACTVRLPSVRQPQPGTTVRSPGRRIQPSDCWR